MLVFIGVSLFLLLRWAQVDLAEDTESRFYHRWWVALVGTLLSVVIVLLAGLGVTAAAGVKAQLYDGTLEGADY